MLMGFNLLLISSLVQNEGIPFSLRLIIFRKPSSYIFQENLWIRNNPLINFDQSPRDNSFHLEDLAILARDSTDDGIEPSHNATLLLFAPDTLALFLNRWIFDLCNRELIRNQVVSTRKTNHDQPLGNFIGKNLLIGVLECEMVCDQSSLLPGVIKFHKVSIDKW
jgi:hypothetical protein